MPTFMFVHGTGVRKPGYLATIAVLKRALLPLGVSDVEDCLWGDRLGAQTARLCLPGTVQPIASQSLTDEQELARWELLTGNPMFELCMLNNRPRERSDPIRPDAVPAGKALFARLQTYRPEGDVAALLREWSYDGHWEAAWRPVIDHPVTKAVFDEAPGEVGEPAQATARAVIVSLLSSAAAEGRPGLDAHRRDALVRMLVKAWGADVAGIGTFLLRFFGDLIATSATPFLAKRRATVSDVVSPVAGDILIYQARGAAIRRHIARRVADINANVILLAHSLGGIACVDLLARHRIPNVTGLITVGSQAGLFHEIGALYSLRPGAPLPDHFPRWINLFDPHDFLSYLAKPVFGSERVDDVAIDSGQPFPHAHGAYWANPATWNAIGNFLR
jgi:hypothetical protein